MAAAASQEPLCFSCTADVKLSVNQHNEVALYVTAPLIGWRVLLDPPY